jgi:hypothetical protein
MAIFPSLASRNVDTSSPNYGWLPRMDSNHDKQIQNLQCYRYTTRQPKDINRSSRNIQSWTSGNKFRESHIHLGPPALLA